jgi:hypothetical protein
VEEFGDLKVRESPHPEECRVARNGGKAEFGEASKSRSKKRGDLGWMRKKVGGLNTKDNRPQVQGAKKEKTQELVVLAPARYY